MKNLLGEQSIRGKERIKACSRISALDTRTRMPLNDCKNIRSMNFPISSHSFHSLLMADGVGIAQS